MDRSESRSSVNQTVVDMISICRTQIERLSSDPTPEALDLQLRYLATLIRLLEL